MPATLSRNLELIIGARDKLTGPIRKMRAAFQRFKKFAGVAAKAASVAFAAATVAVVAFGKVAVDIFAEFETAMRNVFTLLDIGQAQFEALGDSILKMSLAVPQTPEQLGSAIYDIISAGVGETSDAMIVLETSARAAVAGLTSTRDAAGAGVTVMNAFGKSVEEIPDIFDLLFSTVKEGKLEFNELGPVVGRTSAAFVGAGGSLVDMLGSLAFLTKTTGNANESSTALVAAMNALTKAGPALKKELGTAVFDVSGNMRRMTEIVGDMRKGLEGMTKEAQLEKIKKLVPEKEAQKALVAMISRYELLSSSISNVADRQDALTDATKKQMGTWAVQMRLLKNSFEVIRIAVGELLTTLIGPEMGKFSKWMKGIATSLVENKAAIMAFATAIIPAIKTAGTGIVQAVKGSFEIAWGFIKEFFMRVQESPRPLLVLLGGLFLEIPKLLWTALQQAWQVVKGIAKIIFTPFQGALLWVGDQIRVWFQEKLRKPFVEFLNWAIEKSNKVREFFGKEPWELFPVEVETEKAISFEEAWKDTFDVLQKRFQDLGKVSREAVVKTVDEAVMAVRELAGTLKGELITPDLKAKMEALETTLLGIPKALEEGYVAAGEAATEAGKKAKKALEAAREAAGEKPGEPGAPPPGAGIGEQAESFGDMFGKAFGAALGFAGGNAVAQLIGLLFEAINEGDVAGFVDKIVDGAINFIIALAKGIPDFVLAIIDRAPDIITALVSAIPILIAGIIQHVPEILAALASGVANLFKAAAKTFALAFLTLVEKLIGGLLRFLGIELRDDIKRLQGEVESLYAAATTPRDTGEPTQARVPGAASDFARAAAATPSGQPVVVYNIEFAQPFVMTDQASMDKFARMLAEADYRQARRSQGTTGT